MRADTQALPTAAKAIVERLNTPLIAADSAGTIVFANAEIRDLLQYSVDALIGKNITMILEQEGYYPDSFRGEDGEETTRAVLLLHKDHHVIPANIHTVFLNEPALCIHEINVPSQDELISRDSQQRIQLAQISRLATMGQMASSIAHEVNQPMGAITLYAQTAQRFLNQPDLDREKLASVLHKISEQALRAGAIIENIQNFTQTGDAAETINLNECLAEIQHLISNDALASGVEVNYDLTPVQVWVKCDAHEIQQVVVNLCQNAIEAMAAIECRYGSSIRISTERDGHWVFVRVSDSGGGIPEDAQASMFKPFFSTKNLGTGLGLNMCKSIIEDAGGTIKFENKPDGTGCTFSFTLPLTTPSD